MLRRSILALVGMLTLALSGFDVALRGAASDVELPAGCGDRALRHVADVVALGSRVPGTNGHKNAIDFITSTLRRAGVRVRHDRFSAQTPVGPRTFTNIVAEIGPTTGPVVLIGGHYDTWSGPNFVGANDAGSSTGLLLELARHFAARPANAAHGVWIVFFDGEEAFRTWSETDGLYGSRHFAQQVAGTPHVHLLRAVIVLDMVGDKDLNINDDETSTPWLRRFVRHAAVTRGVAARFDGETITMTDDHTPFLDLGIPSLLIADFQFGPLVERGDPLGSFHHSDSDTLDKVSSDSLETVCRVVTDLVDLIEGQTARP